MIENEMMLTLSLGILDGAQLASTGISMHLEDHPELDHDTQAILRGADEAIALMAALCSKLIESAVTFNEKIDEILS